MPAANSIADPRERSQPQRRVVYTDGACSGNPGPGGWGWVVPDGPSGSGGTLDTTNQRMELRAVIEAIRALDGPLHIVSDSTYVVNCFRDEWWRGWLGRGWKNSQKKPVANRDLWEPLIETYQHHDITFEWVKGHSGDRWNEQADQLAVTARSEVIAGGDPAAKAGAKGAVGGASGVMGGPGMASDATDDSTLRLGQVVETKLSRSSAVLAQRRIAVVGHRPPQLGGYEANPIAVGVKGRMVEILQAKAQMFDGVTVLTGLGLGAEMFGAEAAIEAGLAFEAILAFPDPSSRWPKSTQERFDDLIDQAVDTTIVDKKVPASPNEVAQAFRRRDRWLQKEADEAIVVSDALHKPTLAQLADFESALGDEVWVIDPSHWV